MSCDTNTHKVTVLGDLGMEHYRGRHWRGDYGDGGADCEVGLKDLFQAARDGEAHRDILREVLESKFVNVRETLEAKAEVLAAIALSQAEAEKARCALSTQILENRVETE